LSLVAFLVILGSNKEAIRGTIKAQEVEKVKEALSETSITQKVVQNELLAPEESFEEPEGAERDIIGTVQGPVTGVEVVLMDMAVMVDGMHIDAGSVDLTGLQIGDVVKVTYLEKKYGRFMESIEVIEPAEDKLLRQKEPLRKAVKAVERGGCLLRKKHEK